MKRRLCCTLTRREALDLGADGNHLARPLGAEDVGKGWRHTPKRSIAMACM
jgi:hypothetical protein